MIFIKFLFKDFMFFIFFVVRLIISFILNIFSILFLSPFFIFGIFFLIFLTKKKHIKIYDSPEDKYDEENYLITQEKIKT